MSYLIALLFALIPTLLGFANESRGFSVNNQRVTRVAIIDTGLDIEDIRFKDHICPEVGQDFTGGGLADVHGHGTHIAGLIQQNAGPANYCFIILKYYSETARGFVNMNHYLAALDSLYRFHPDVVNYSGGGDNSDEIERSIIANFPKTRFFVAAGNDGHDLDLHCDNFPACYADKLQNITVVGNLNGASSNFGKVVTSWFDGNNIESTVPYAISSSGLARMTGTSMSTALATGHYLHEHY